MPKKKPIRAYYVFRTIARLLEDQWVDRRELAMLAGFDTTQVTKRPWYFVTFEPWVNIKKGPNGKHLYQKKPGVPALEMEQDYRENAINSREAKIILRGRREGRLKPVV